MVRYAERALLIHGIIDGEERIAQVGLAHIVDHEGAAIGALLQDARVDVLAHGAQPRPVRQSMQTDGTERHAFLNLTSVLAFRGLGAAAPLTSSHARLPLPLAVAPWRGGGCGDADLRFSITCERRIGRSVERTDRPLNGAADTAQ